jgi:hypothetical protein
LKKFGHCHCFVVLPLLMIFCNAFVILWSFLKSWTYPESAMKEGTVDVNWEDIAVLCCVWVVTCWLLCTYPYYFSPFSPVQLQFTRVGVFLSSLTVWDIGPVWLLLL